jgi:phospholipid-binding lipoprotein MlaA
LTHDITDAARRAGRGAAATLLAIAIAAALAAAPAAAADSAPKDPLERLNRATFAFNDAFDRMLARPAAKAYKAVVPEKGRQVVSNFLANLAYPTVIVNDALQAKFHDAGTDSARFLANTVIGIGGLFDPATRFGLAIHDQDFGSTLGHWGVPAGPYFVLPFLGPSDFRDAPSKLVDHYTGGDYNLKYLDDGGWNYSTVDYGLYALRLLDRRTELLATDETLEQAFDKYAVVRNAYVARRQYLVLDGNIPEETYDEPDDATAPAGAPAAPQAQPQPAQPPPAAQPQTPPQPPAAPPNGSPRADE